MDTIWQVLLTVFGTADVSGDMPAWQMLLRGIAVYFAALLMVRLGKRRFLGRYTSFDILLGFVVGSLMARAISGAITMLNMAAVVATLLSLHWLLTWLAMHFRVGSTLKGSARQLIKDGEVDRAALDACGIGDNDLGQALREKGVESPDRVRAAYFERDGSITIIAARRAEVLRIQVVDGVQQVHIVVDG